MLTSGLWGDGTDSVHISVDSGATTKPTEKQEVIFKKCRNLQRKNKNHYLEVLTGNVLTFSPSLWWKLRSHVWRVLHLIVHQICQHFYRLPSVDNTPLLNIEYSVLWKVFTLEQFIFCWPHRPFATFAFGTGIFSGQTDSLIIY